MNIILYTNTSEKNKVDKSLTKLGNTITGTLRSDCSIIDPVIALENISDYITSANYAYIQQFGRYYYINNIICTGKLFELHMHVDVLYTYRSQIRACNAVVARQQSLYNLYLQDGVFKTYADNHYQIKQFPSGFNTQQFIFSVAG